LAERSGRAFDTFASTRQRTRSELDRLARALENAPLVSGLSILVFGSWAREELTPESDDDWALLAAEPFDADDAAIRAGVETAATVLGTEGKAPGAQAVFGVPFDARSLIERVGLDADTNTNLTRRLLLLLESREVAGDARTGAPSVSISKASRRKPWETTPSGSRATRSCGPRASCFSPAVSSPCCSATYCAPTRCGASSLHG
jgi:Putative nucleotidyltransferase DUF294